MCDTELKIVLSVLQHSIVHCS